MNLFKFMRMGHKWVGIVLALVFLLISVTGFLLLEKKQFAWIQPPTQKGAAGETTDLISTQEVIAAALAAGHPDFRRAEDIDRIDFRPGKRLHKVRSAHNHSEVQIDAVTGEVLGTGVRRSDLLEALHDGSFFGDAVHDLLLPVTAISLFFLTISGLYLWLQPIYRRNHRKNNH